MAILPENEYTEFEGKYYIDPNVSLGEQNAFIDNLRSTQQANNQQIKTDTYNLGTAVPSNLGGLVGGEGYFTSRYQTPQTNNLVNNLKSVAQANALNQVLANEQEKWKTRYTRASNAAKLRGSNGGGGSGSGDPTTEGGVDTEDNTTLADHKWAQGDTPVEYYDNTGLNTGWGEATDGLTGEFDFTLPDGRRVALGGWNHQLKVGSDGNFYIYDTQNHTYEPILGGSGNYESSNTNTRWWNTRN